MTRLRAPLLFALFALLNLSPETAFTASRNSHSQLKVSERKTTKPPFAEMSPAQFRRLDPHGTHEMAINRATFLAHSECRTCHVDLGTMVGVRSDVQNVCVSCHGNSPHSGAAEHLKHKLNCLSCHLPHRADKPAPWPEIEESAKQFVPDVHRELPPELIVKSHPKPRIRKSCKECHK